MTLYHGSDIEVREPKIIPEILDYYDKEVVQSIFEKYGYSHLDALRLFVSSETHRMLENPKFEMQKFASGVLFDMREAEKITGAPTIQYISEKAKPCLKK